MPVGEWFDEDTIRDVWIDAPDDEETLEMLVGAALVQVQTYIAWDPESTADVPANYRQAQLMQTRNLWNAAAVDPSGGMGGGDFVLRPFPLDWQVKLLLKPKGAVPVIG